jgi:hypothetical protein
MDWGGLMIEEEQNKLIPIVIKFYMYTNNKTSSTNNNIR